MIYFTDKTQDVQVILFDKIPLELRQTNQWINWRLEERKGKKTKTPYNSKTGRMAQTNNSATWSTFEVAKKSFLNSANYSGVGLVFSEGDGLFGIDIDHCFEDDQSKTDIAEKILAKFKNTYCEISPSQTGLRIFGKGNPLRCGKGRGGHKWIEIYNHRSPRYLTVTGHHVPESALQLADCQEALDWLHENFFATTTSPVTVNHTLVKMTNAHDIIKHCRRAANAFKFEDLFNGGGTDDQSSGDLSLCLLMAFYCQDESILDAAFRMSRRVNLTNGKWDKKHKSTGETYGQLTLRKALSGVSQTYAPHLAFKPPKKNGALPNTTPSPLGGLSTLESTSEPNWTEKLIYKGKRLAPIARNVRLIIENTEQWKGVIRYNEFTQRIDKVKAPPYNQAKVGQWTDSDDIRTQEWLAELTHYDFPKQAVWDGIFLVATNYSFHPVNDYLTSLNWDGVPRIEDFFSDYFGTEKSNYTSMVAKVLFLSAVARIFQPGCKSDYVPILEGAQGIGKSSVIRHLLPNPNYFSDTPFDIGSKDAYLAMRGKWIVELAELDSMNKADADRAKAFFSSSVDTYREPYGKNVVDTPRQCVFIGTVNKDTYLKDETGNRRYLPIRCNSIDVQGVIKARDQLWAEAVYRLNRGEQWWPDNSLADEMKEHQEARYDQDVWQSTIESFVCIHSGGVTMEDITSRCLKIELNQVDKRTEMRISKILKRLGYSKLRISDGAKRKIIYQKPNKLPHLCHTSATPLPHL